LMHASLDCNASGRLHTAVGPTRIAADTLPVCAVASGFGFARAKCKLLYFSDQVRGRVLN
jgi:hypothetical protein